jgi:hypothetical protein
VSLGLAARGGDSALPLARIPGDGSDDDYDGASSSPTASSLSVFLLLPLLGRPAGDRSCQRVRSAAGRRAAAAAAAALRRNSVDSKVFPRSPSARPLQ